MGHSKHDIEKLCARSNVLNGLAIRGGEVKASEKEIIGWLTSFESNGKQFGKV